MKFSEIYKTIVETTPITESFSWKKFTSGGNYKVSFKGNEKLNGKVFNITSTRTDEDGLQELTIHADKKMQDGFEKGAKLEMAPIWVAGGKESRIDEKNIKITDIDSNNNVIVLTYKEL